MKVYKMNNCSGLNAGNAYHKFNIARAMQSKGYSEVRGLFRSWSVRNIFLSLCKAQGWTVQVYSGGRSAYTFGALIQFNNNPAKTKTAPKAKPARRITLNKNNFLQSLNVEVEKARKQMILNEWKRIASEATTVGQLIALANQAPFKEFKDNLEI